MITQERSGDGHSWRIPADGKDAEVDIWWMRGAPGDKTKRRLGEERLVIRQEVAGEQAALVVITFGQVYDLIKALNTAVVET